MGIGYCAGIPSEACSSQPARICHHRERAGVDIYHATEMVIGKKWIVIADFRV